MRRYGHRIGAEYSSVPQGEHLAQIVKKRANERRLNFFPVNLSLG